MIFVTVGHQMPFDRLVRAMDAWAGTQEGVDVFAQIGATVYVPQHLRWEASLHPDRFRRLVEEADVVVAHAGMGTILTALEVGTPILVMPRRGALQETRNDHQVATAERLRAMRRVHVAMDETELAKDLERISELGALPHVESRGSPELLKAISDFVADA